MFSSGRKFLSVTTVICNLWAIASAQDVCDCSITSSLTNQYEICSCPKSWSDAQVHCAEKNSALAVITDADEDERLQELLQAQTDQDLWIGGQKTFKGWYWVASGQLLRQQGCYEPQSVHSVNFTSSQMTINMCLDECGALRYPFAGIKGRDTCYCSLSVANFTTANGCKMRCVGNISHVCGGPNAVYWWAVTDVATNWFESGEPSKGTFDKTEECLAAKCTLTDQDGGGDWSWEPYNCFAEYGYACEYDKDSTGGCKLGKPGLVEVDDRCLFIESSNFKTWYESRAFCRRDGGRLVEATTDAVLLQLARSLDCTKQPFWLGSSLTELRWISSDMVVYSNWLPGGPLSMQSGCFYMAGSEQFEWSISDCGTSKAFVCQTGITPISTTTGLPPLSRTTTVTTTPTTMTTVTMTTPTTTTTVTMTTPTITTTITMATPTTRASTISTRPTTTRTDETVTTTRPSTVTTTTQSRPSSATSVSERTTTTASTTTTSMTTTTVPESFATDGSSKQDTSDLDTDPTKAPAERNNLAGVILIIIGGLLVLTCFSIGLATLFKKCANRHKSQKRDITGIFVKDEDFSYVGSTISESGSKKRSKNPLFNKDMPLDRYNSIDITESANNPPESIEVESPKFELGDTDKNISEKPVEGIPAVQTQDSTSSEIVRPSIDGASHTGSDSSQDAVARTVVPVYNDSGLDLRENPLSSGFIVPIGEAEYAPPNRYSSFA